MTLLSERLIRSRFAGFALLGILCTASPGASPLRPPARHPLNLLLITIDTWRADRLGSIEPVRGLTPNLDRIAEKGACFSRAFAHTPTTLPSHVNILTGTTPPFHGVHDNFNFAVRKDLPLLSQHLKDHGYVTGAFVAAYPLDSRFGLDRGFDVYDDDYSRRHDESFTSPERRAKDVVESSAAWLRERTSPWFAWIHCYDPHTPYDPPEPFRSRFTNAYDGEVAYVDTELGKLFDDLRNTGDLENTLIVITGDHGESLGEHGENTHAFFAYNSTLWVPLVIAGPGIRPARIDRFVSHIEIFPTVCDLLGLPAPSNLQGLSLQPILAGKTRPHHPIYFESLYPYYSRGWAPIRGFITGKSKFIHSPLPERYDLNADFSEKRNVITSRGMAVAMDQLDRLIKNLSNPGTAAARRAFNRDTLEKLRSLGYLSGSSAVSKKTFSRKDDVKLLLPALEEAESAWSLYESGREEEAIHRLTDVISKSPNLDMAYKRLAGIHSRQGRYDQALDVLRTGRDRIPTSYEIYVDFIKTLNNAGRFQAAARELENSDFAPVEFDPEMWYNLGLAYSRTGKLEQAARALDKGYALDARYPELMELMAEVAFQQASRTRDNSLLVRAEKLFKEALELDPNYARTYNGLGQTYRATGRLDEAIQLWKTAQEKEPGHPGSLFNLGAGLLEQGEFKQALPHLRRYKQLFYNQISPRLQKNLDALIIRCLKGK